VSSVPLAPVYTAELACALDAFHRASFARLASDPETVHHLFYLELDDTAAIWAGDEDDARAIAGALRDLLRLLLQDDELELIVHGFAACEGQP
jgi:hypothetical protein